MGQPMSTENAAGWDRRSDPSVRAMIDAEKEALRTAENDTGSTCTLCGHRGLVEHPCPASDARSYEPSLAHMSGPAHLAHSCTAQCPGVIPPGSGHD